MADFITGIIETLGYPGIVLLMLVENVFPPIPSELVMPFAGMVASRGDKLNFWGVIASGTLGSVLGALPLYHVGRHIGEERLKDWAGRHGGWIGFSAEDVDRARTWFERHGNATVFFCRLVPAVRSIISIPAGVEKMSLLPFLAYTTAGSAIWTTMLAYAGRLLGANYQSVEKYLDPVTWTVLGALVLLWLYRVVKQQTGGAQHREREHA